jgi:hypothetical protein
MLDAPGGLRSRGLLRAPLPVTIARTKQAETLLASAIDCAEDESGG